MISLRSSEPQGSNAPKVAGQIETPRPPDPIMRRPCADCEEKRVIHGRDIRQEEEEQLDSRNPIREDFSTSRVSTLLSSAFSAVVRFRLYGSY